MIGWKRFNSPVARRLCAGAAVRLPRLQESDGITGKLISAPWDPWQELQIAERSRGTDIYTLRRIVPKDRGPWGDNNASRDHRLWPDRR